MVNLHLTEGTEEQRLRKAKEDLQRRLKQASRKNQEPRFIEALSTLLACDEHNLNSFADIAVNVLYPVHAGLALAYADVFSLWSTIINGCPEQRRQWQQPWLIQPVLAEKFKGGRPVFYQGERNQLLAGAAINFIEAQRTRAGEDACACAAIARQAQVDEWTRLRPKLADIQPITSLASPAQADASSSDTQFFRFPVWLAEDFVAAMSPSQKATLEQIKHRNHPKPRWCLGTSLAQVVTDKIECERQAHNITIADHRSRALYTQGSRVVHLPRPEQFECAISYYAVWSHELAHSTQDVTQRSGKHEKKGKKLRYAIEELVAESCAFLAVKRLERDMRQRGPLSVEDESAFQDAYERSANYHTEWGLRTSKALREILLAKRRNGVFYSIINDTLAANRLMASGEPVTRLK
ncbi:zincin-like metallopeptidase domain-containing protein [Ferrimonas marina]|uniref:Polyvalent protein metallopeptidase domain-containing protein n=1 Tax=Ferrimonas marina TaxID=299255 RepID=A0A1M5U287_9GAMM|nr:zincin-like metallopeptidase domain-containing protein [Ferrimonas marina]SHH56753.1 hypothetical protein SAMN02745129_2364 [Ferrimonas marina]